MPFWRHASQIALIATKHFGTHNLVNTASTTWHIWHNWISFLCPKFHEIRLFPNYVWKQGLVWTIGPLRSWLVQPLREHWRENTPVSFSFQKDPDVLQIGGFPPGLRLCLSWRVGSKKGRDAGCEIPWEKALRLRFIFLVNCKSTVVFYWNLFEPQRCMLISILYKSMLLETCIFFDCKVVP